MEKMGSNAGSVGSGALGAVVSRLSTRSIFFSVLLFDGGAISLSSDVDQVFASFSVKVTKLIASRINSSV
jgi:hypothetical protein